MKYVFEISIIVIHFSFEINKFCFRSFFIELPKNSVNIVAIYK